MQFKKSSVFCILVLFMLFLSCRKDKLKDEKQTLEGKWKWIYSTERRADARPLFTI